MKFLCALLLLLTAAAALGQEPTKERSPGKIFSIIKDQKDQTPAALLRELGDMDTDAAFGYLKRAVGEMNGRPGKQRVFAAMKPMLANPDLAPKVMKFASKAAKGRDDNEAQAAANAMVSWGEIAHEALLEAASEGASEMARSRSMRGILGLLKSRADQVALEIALDAFRVPESGSFSQGSSLFAAFTTEESFKAMGKFVARPKSPTRRIILIVDAMGRHKGGADPAVDSGANAVLMETLKTKNPELQYYALVAMAARGQVGDKRYVERLTGSDDGTVRRAALVALIRAESDGIDSFELAEDKDSIVRQAAAIGLAQLATPEAVERLHQMLGDESHVVRAVVVDGLALVRDPSSIPALIEQMDQEKGRLRSDIRDALVSLTALDLGTRVGSWRAFWKKEGRDFQVPSPEKVAEAAKARAEAKSAGKSEVAFYGITIESNSFALIIDTSGSMSQKGYQGKTRLELAKEQLAKTMERIRDGVLFNIIPFSGGAVPMEDGLVEMSEDQREEASMFVEFLRPGGGTNIYDAVSAAFEDERVDTIYLMSDGSPSAGAITDAVQLRAEVARWNSVRGVVIHAIAVGQDHALLKGLAADSGGTYVHVE